LKANLGSLDKIKRVIKVFGMVNSTLDFEKHPFVINGCSELFAMIWGEENGIGVRSAVGMGSLPDNIPVEIEAIFELSYETEETAVIESVKEIRVENE
jgi:enamine deaminase RidA (YjgF/YER057c/UK114 family)